MSNSFKEIMDRAMQFAFDSHKGQYRKGSGLPYIVHPVAVVNLLVSWKVKCVNTLAAGAAHDTMEDCPGVTIHVLEVRLPAESAKIVEELTFRSTDMDKAAYMKTFSTKLIGSLVVKVADRLSNVMDFHGDESTRDYSHKYFMKGTDLYDAVEDRRQEIIDVYGEEVYENIVNDIAAIELTITSE